MNIVRFLGNYNASTEDDQINIELIKPATPASDTVKSVQSSSAESSDNVLQKLPHDLDLTWVQYISDKVLGKS